MGGRVRILRCCRSIPAWDCEVQDEDDKSAEGATGSKMEVRGGILDTGRTGVVAFFFERGRAYRSTAGAKLKCADPAWTLSDVVCVFTAVLILVFFFFYLPIVLYYD